MAEQTIYRLIFQSQGKVYEIYAGEVSHHGMLGFVEVAKLEFGRKTELVLDPTEEHLKTEFEGVQRTWLPLHSIIRIDQVDKRGTARISDARGGNVTPFPVSYLPQNSDPPKSTD